MNILFLPFTREDIGVAMVTNMISQLQESFPLRRAAGSFEISFTKWLRGAKTVQLPVTFSMSQESTTLCYFKIRFCCYRIFLFFIRILTFWNRKYKYYCLYFSFITLYPGFITSFNRHFAIGDHFNCTILLFRK